MEARVCATDARVVRIRQTSAAEHGKSYFEGLLEAGLEVSLGWVYRGKECEFGWARIQFCVAEEVMRETVAGFDAFCEPQRWGIQDFTLLRSKYPKVAGAQENCDVTAGAPFPKPALLPPSHQYHGDKQDSAHHTMAPPPSPTIKTLLRYTYQANMVFFAGFGAWYMLKGPGRGQEQDIAALTHRGDDKAARDMK